MREAQSTGQQAEASVHERIVDQASMGVLILRQEDPRDLRSFRLIYANPAASEASRFDMGPTVGTMLVESFPNVTDELLQTYVDVIESGSNRDIGELQYGDENIPDSVFSLTVSHLGGREVAVTYENITERLNAQNALRAGRETARRLADENAALAEIGRIISSSPDLDDVYEGFAEQVGKLIPSDRIAISVLTPERDAFTNQYVVGSSAPGRQPGQVAPLAGTLIEAAVRRKATQIVHGEPEELRARFSNLALADLRSSLLAPIIHRGEVIAVLNLRSAQPDRYTDHHRALAERVAAQIAGTIANAQAYAEQRRIEAALRESEEKATMLAQENASKAEIGRISTQSMDFDDVYRRFAQEVGNLFPVDRVVIGLLNEDETEIANTYVTGLDVPGRRHDEPQPLRGTLSEEVLQAGSGRIIHIDDEEDFQSRFPGLLPEVEAGLRSFLSVPLVTAGIAQGCLHLRSARQRAYSEDHLRLAEQVALQIVGAVANSRLYTELGHAKDELERQAEELRRSNSELEQFANVASHDLQQPLRAISGHIRLLARRYRGKLDRDADEFMGFVTDGADRMQLLIDALLEYARVGSEGAPLVPTDCEEVLERAVSNVQPIIGESSAAVSHDALPYVRGDSTQLVQLFQNLLGNAIKFRGERAPSIHVSATRRGGRYVFAVADNGIGIAPDYQEAVFGMFKRLHSRGRYPGTGLGLSICSKIVDRHGGRIWVESEPNRGSTFYFELEAAT